MSKKNCNGYNGKNKKKVRPRTRWRDKVEDGLNVKGIRKGQVVIRDRR